MRTVRRLLYREIIGASVFVMAAFIGLFFFFDVINEIDDLSRYGNAISQALAVCVLLIPGHVYDLMPIAVLIGGIYALARLAQSSEFTILRTGGLGPSRALGLLGTLGLAFALLTFAIGDALAPWCETQASLLQSRRSGGLDIGPAGAWLRDAVQTPEGERQVTLNIGAALSHGEVARVRIFEFDAKGTLRTRIEAKRATVGDNGLWQLADVSRSHWPAVDTTAAPLPADEHLATLDWQSNLNRDVLSAAVLPLRTMSTAALFTYMTHLSDHEQAAQRYEIQFWKKALYPFASLVMLALALPFAYLHGRGGGISYKVFGGIMLGISYVLLNSISSHLGLLRNWTPWIAAMAPSAAYLLLSMAAFAWLVRFR
ncbi:MAG: LPS export ABC transporter permease LptG [Burkholderiales bacterium]